MLGAGAASNSSLPTSRAVSLMAESGATEIKSDSFSHK